MKYRNKAEMKELKKTTDISKNTQQMWCSLCFTVTLLVTGEVAKNDIAREIRLVVQ